MIKITRLTTPLNPKNIAILLNIPFVLSGFLKEESDVSFKDIINFLISLASH